MGSDHSSAFLYMHYVVHLCIKEYKANKENQSL